MLPQYGFVKAKLNRAPQLKPTSRGGGETQYHLHFGLDVAGAAWDVAMNVGTNNAHDLLKYRLARDFSHPITGMLQAAPEGSNELTGRHALPALDFDRGDILNNTGDWLDSDLMNGEGDTNPATPLKALLETAMEAGHDVYVFGRYYTHGGKGIHDTHMNQGSTGEYLNPADPDPEVAAELKKVQVNPDGNQIWQDGALLIDTGDGTWAAYFAAFDQQFLPTNDYGNPAEGSKPVGA
jgi:uncharacterized protein YukJ